MHESARLHFLVHGKLPRHILFLLAFLQDVYKRQDVRCLAQRSFHVTFHGKRAHAALAPDKGRSAFDALLAAFQGIEFLREHVPDDVRMHYTVAKLPGPARCV